MMEMPTYSIVVYFVTKTWIDSIDLRHLNDILTIWLSIMILENKTWFGLLYVLISVLIKHHVHVDVMIIIVRPSLVVHALTWLVIHFVLNLVQAIFILTKLKLIGIPHIL